MQEMEILQNEVVSKKKIYNGYGGIQKAWYNFLSKGLY